MKLFQVIGEGSLWGVYAVSASDPNDRRLAGNSLTASEQFAIDVAAELNRLAATHEVKSEESCGVNTGDDSDISSRPMRSIRLED